LLVWLPLALGYPLAASFMAENPVAGIFYGLRSAAIAGFLIVAVWWLTGRLRWPDRPNPRFYLAHVGAALAYAGTWWITTVTLGGLNSPTPVGAYIRDFATGPYMAWDIMFGVVTYGLVAGVSYAIRAGDRAREAQIRAAETDALATRVQLTALQAQLTAALCAGPGAPGPGSVARGMAIRRKLPGDRGHTAGWASVRAE
jgi:hypothetical protein